MIREQNSRLAGLWSGRAASGSPDGSEKLRLLAEAPRVGEFGSRLRLLNADTLRN